MANTPRKVKVTASSKKNTASSKANARKAIDQRIKIKPIVAEEEVTYKCTCCGTEYKKQIGAFPISNSVLYAANNGYTTVCKTCVDKYYNQLLGFYSGNEAHAMEHCCWAFDWYYSTDLLSQSISTETGRVTPMLYFGKMNLAPNKARGVTYIDTIKQKNLEASAIKSFDDIVDVSTEGSSMEPAADMTPIDGEAIKIFGFGYTREEYEFLLEQYEDWTTRYECKTKAQEELFKSLCIAQLTKQRVERTGTVKEIAEAMRMYQELMQSANIKPNQNKDDAFVEQNTFGKFIKMIENDRPVEEPDEKWKDVDGIYKYIDTFFLGHLCNLTHVKNDNEEAYRKAMEEFTVKPPVYEDDDLNDTSLLDKYSDKADKIEDAD